MIPNQKKLNAHQRNQRKMPKRMEMIATMKRNQVCKEQINKRNKKNKLNRYNYNNKIYNSLFI